MSLSYTGSTGIFTFLGRIFKLLEQVNTCRGTDVAARVDTVIDQLKNDTATTILIESTLSAAPTSLSGWQGSGESFMAQWQAAAVTYLRGVVARDAVQPEDSLANSLAYLIENMEADDYYVDPNAVTLAVTPDAGNSTNDFELMFTTKGGDGKTLENMLAEDIALSLTSVSGNAATVRSLGKDSRASLSHEWPMGSGHSVQFAAADPEASLLTNGDFEDATEDDLPDGWALLDGVPGTDYLLTTPEVQDVVIAGSPTAGGYYLRYTSPGGPVYLTSRLAYNASETNVLEALQAIPGLENVTVSTTGTTPNFTHRVTFTGVAGNLATLAAENQLDTGSITPAQITAGDANGYRGVTLTVVGADAANRRIYQQLPTLAADTVYFVAFRHKKTATPATGSLRVAIVDGYGGSVVQDSAGNSNSATYDLTAGDVTTSFAAGWLAIRVSPAQVQPVFLEIDCQDLETGTTYCIDDVTLVAGTALYAGGPIVAALQGASGPAISDKWILEATNDRAGTFQEWFARVFDMRSRGLLLPSSGSTNIPDSLVA